ncbi:MAG: OmpA family protein [Anaeromyxobacter sp.]|nr:OmpA family protein [Anaeromyxobacter sp.]
MTPTRLRRPRGAAAGTLLTVLLALALVGLGAWLLWRRAPAPGAGAGTSAAAPAAPAGVRPPEGKVPQPIEPVTGSPPLAAAASYLVRDGVVEVDLSEYAGYGGLIVANGGLAPNPDSFFARTYGFQVKLTVGEGETWSQLNNGRFAATATTADALAVQGRAFQAVVPVQIGWSRGADMLVVDSGVATVNQLAGKVVAASQFNEAEFFLRFLAREAGLKVRVLRDLDGRPEPGEVGLVFYEDANAGCDAYQHELAGGRRRLVGCMGWSPRTDEVVEAAQGKAKVLVSNKNLLVVADVLALNRGFAEQHPKLVKGLVHGLLEGNRRLRDDPKANLAVVARAFKWTEADTSEELGRVHLANLPENRAFFAGTIDSAGSFGGIYQSAVLAYGDVIKNPADGARFLDLGPLEALAKEGLFADQRIAIAPIKTGGGASLEGDPLLKKDIRFFFEPNSSRLDEQEPKNAEYLDAVKQFLQVSPGSVVVLRGHVDDAKVADFRQQGGEQLVQAMALKAMELSRQRAVGVRDALVKRHPRLDAKRLETVGRGWEEPVGKDGTQNRRVEVQWFTLE